MTIQQYKEEVAEELKNILNYWLHHTIDEEYGGFYGKINDKDEIIPFAEKGLVLNARILWTFSAAYRQNPQNDYLLIANRAFKYLSEFFKDKTFGGLYWAVDYEGNPLNTRKQIYGQAFAIYGLSEYFKITKNQEVLDWAIELFNVIEEYSYDSTYGGYLEALSQDWGAIEDVKLSEKDANEKKSMNTHLHILEAYANLISVWRNEQIERKLQDLINVFFSHIIDKKTGHQYLFHDEDWTVKSHIISYGHDIETSWLLYEAAQILGNDELINEAHKIALKMSNAVVSGLSDDGGMCYESEGSKHDTDKHWWVQAEAMVGYYNSFKLSKNERYLRQSINVWTFIKNNLITSTGEWYWGVQGEKNQPMPKQDKVGFWKCPYHNARACLEIIK